MARIQTGRGATVKYAGETMKVVGAHGFDYITVQSKDGQFFNAPVEDLIKDATSKRSKPVKVDKKRLEKVEAYKLALAGVMDSSRRTREQVRKGGEALGIKLSTTYKALARYDATGDPNDLPPGTRPGGRGKRRLLGKAEAIITENLEQLLLTREQKRVPLFLERTKAALAKAGLVVSEDTLRSRVKDVLPATWKQRREGYDAAKKLDAHRGGAPTGDRPLEVIQCDHWKTDIEILSDDRLTIIGRAWLTIGIDVYTRVVWGWHLGLESPGSTPTAFCMIRGITRKEGMLKAMGSNARMPFYGVPETLHLDNAGEFRGKTMAAACKHFNIKLKWRPVQSPHYGAHIERLNKTLAMKFKDLPGATGSTTTERKARRPELTAAFTFEDLTQQILMILDEYHNTLHLSIGMTPLEKWSSHYFNEKGQARKTPAIVVDDLALRIPWYPLRECSLQRYGIRLDYLDYYGEELEHLVRNSKRGDAKLEVRRNPLDVREIFVLHPVRAEWMIIPCRHLSFPVATILELRDAKRTALKLKRSPTPEALAQIIEERHQHVALAKKKTKSAARAATVKTNSDRMRAKAPKTFSDVAEDDRIEIIKPSDRIPVDKGPPSRTARDTKFQQPPDLESFTGAAASIAGMSDEEIDEYLDAD